MFFIVFPFKKIAGTFLNINPFLEVKNVSSNKILKNSSIFKIFPLQSIPPFNSNKTKQLFLLFKIWFISKELFF